MSNNNKDNQSAKFSNLKNLLFQLNMVHGTKFKNPLFEWMFDGEHLLIFGNPSDLANLFALLWSNTSDYIFFMGCDNGTNYIRTSAY